MILCKRNYLLIFRIWVCGRFCWEVGLRERVCSICKFGISGESEGVLLFVKILKEFIDMILFVFSCNRVKLFDV